MDAQAVAENIRKRLEARIAKLIGCVEADLCRLKLGTLVHFLFLLEGPSETIGGFNTSMAAILDLLGREIVWADPADREEKPPLTEPVVVN